MMKYFDRQISASPYDIYSLKNVAVLLWQRTIVSLTTFPGLRGWAETALLFLVLAVPAYFLTTLNGWYDKPPNPYPSVWLSKFAGALLVPAFVEEIVMRVWMVPHRKEVVTKFWRYSAILGAVLIYVAIHPLNGIINGGSKGEIFLRPEFILIVSMLGIITHMSYQRTGSVWAPTLIHALLVTCWSILRG